MECFQTIANKLTFIAKFSTLSVCGNPGYICVKWLHDCWNAAYWYGTKQYLLRYSIHQKFALWLRKSVSLWERIKGQIRPYCFQGRAFLQMKIFTKMQFNPFVPNAPFLYLTVFWCFQGVEKGCIGNEWVKLKYLENRYKYSLYSSIYKKCSLKSVVRFQLKHEYNAWKASIFRVIPVCIFSHLD